MPISWIIGAALLSFADLDPLPWNARQEAYFDGIVLDVARSGAKIGGQTIPLFDCSTQKMRCLRSELFELKLPMRCEGGQAALEALGNVILGSRPGSAGEGHLSTRMDDGRVFYLQNPAFPGFVWEYDYAYGVVLILYDRKVIEGKPATVDFANYWPVALTDMAIHAYQISSEVFSLALTRSAPATRNL